MVAAWVITSAAQGLMCTESKLSETDKCIYLFIGLCLSYKDGKYIIDYMFCFHSVQTQVTHY